MNSTTAPIERAVGVLMAGGVVAFPTETVYGLGADASDAAAVARIYEAKGRPSTHPVIVHIASADHMPVWACDIPPEAQALAQAFWPGPLTLILKRAASVPAAVSGGQDSIGLRCPSHPVAQSLLRAFVKAKSGGLAGIAAPSANRFGRVSPTRAEHVREEFPEAVAAGMPVLEGGESEVGIESTIVDLSRLGSGAPPALLRPGAVSAGQIEKVLGRRLMGADAHAPRVSGSLKAHYAPRTPMRLCDEQALGANVMADLANTAGEVAVVGHSASLSALAGPRVWVICLPAEPNAYAHRLYATLRAVDQRGVDGLVWQRVPSGVAWDGVRDRLERAAAAFEADRAPEP